MFLDVLVYKVEYHSRRRSLTALCHLSTMP